MRFLTAYFTWIYAYFLRMIFLAKMHSTFFVSLDLQKKGKNSRIRGILIATREGRRILHNDKQKTELTQISS